MSTELTNLLPRERVRTLERGYFFRLATVGLFFLVILIGIHAALLIPTYWYTKEQESLARNRLAELSQERAEAGFEDLAVRMNTFTERAGQIEALARTPSASDAVRGVLALPLEDITLTSFTYAPPNSDGTGGRMTVVGTSKTREALRAFDSSLSSLSFVSSTDLPLSAYAKESDIPFSISLSLTYTSP